MNFCTVYKLKMPKACLEDSMISCLSAEHRDIRAKGLKAQLSLERKISAHREDTYKELTWVAESQFGAETVEAAYKIGDNTRFGNAGRPGMQVGDIIAAGVAFYAVEPFGFHLLTGEELVRLKFDNPASLGDVVEKVLSKKKKPKTKKQKAFKEINDTMRLAVDNFTATKLSDGEDVVIGAVIDALKAIVNRLKVRSD